MSDRGASTGIGWLVFAAACLVALLFLVSAYCARARDLDGLYAMIPVSDSRFLAAQPATATQVGGTHYKDMAIQPADFIRTL